MRPIRRQKRGAALVRDDRSASRNSCRQLFGDLTSPPAATTPAPPLTNLTTCKTSQDPALSCQPQKCPLGRRYASALAGTKAAKTGHFSALLVIQRLVVQKLLTSPPPPLRPLFKQTTRDGAGAAPDTAAAAFAGDAARDPTRDPILARACLAERAHAIACHALAAYLASTLAQRAVHHRLRRCVVAGERPTSARSAASCVSGGFYRRRRLTGVSLRMQL